MTSLAGRYTSSPESTMESDLARLRDIETGDEFLRAMNRICEAHSPPTTGHNLPNELATSSPRSPSLFAYSTALVPLKSKVFFSDRKVADALEPSIRAKRAAAERHHLFPEGFLKTLGCTEIQHALPDGWEQMAYPDFLAGRRGRMAQVIKAGYERLDGCTGTTADLTLEELVGTGETTPANTTRASSTAR